MRNHICFLLFFVALACFSAPKPVAEYDFDGNSGDGILKGKAKARYEEGRKGTAIVLGDVQLAIPCPKGVNTEEGSVTMWVKPLNWDSEVQEFVTFLQTLAPDKKGRMMLYKYVNPKGLGLTFWFGRLDGAPGTRPNRYANQNPYKMEKGKWKRLGISWSKKAKLIVLNVDGVQVASSQYIPEMHFDAFGDFLLNPPAFRPANRAYETAFDMLRFYSSALSEEDMNSTYEAERSDVAAEVPMSKLQSTVFTVPKMAKPPKLDGSFEAPEWADAAKAGGFLSLNNPNLDMRPSVDAFMGHDGSKIYVCFVGKIPGATQLAATIKERDKAVYMDDAYEIHLRPPEMPTGYYQGIFNSIDAIFDAKTGDNNWNGKWEVKNGIYEGQWICELAMPVSEFQSSINEGERWKFNLCRDRQMGAYIQFSCLSPSMMPFFAHYGDLFFTSSGCYGRIDLDYDALFDRNLILKFTAGNCGKQPRKVSLTCEKYDYTGALQGRRDFTGDVLAGGSKDFEWKEALAGFRSGYLRLVAKDDMGNVFHRQDFPLVFKDEVSVHKETDIDSAKLYCDVDMGSHYKLANAVSAKARLIPAEGAPIEITLEGKPSAKGVFDLSKVKEGDCELLLTFYDKDKKELLRVSQSYKHIGRPRWLTEKPGENAGVIWPYTPIQRKGHVLSVWGREHIFGKSSLLPEQIVSQGCRLFASAPVLRGKLNGKDFAFRKFSFKDESVGPAMVGRLFSASAGKMRVNGKFTLEYDGLLWYEFDVEGAGKLEELTLEMELPEEIAQVYNAHYFAREKYVGQLKEDLSLKIIPSIWLGNLDVGLTLCTESFQHWHNADANKVFEIRRQGKTVKWIAHLVDAGVELAAKKNLHYGFGIEANPVKPTPANFRSWRVGPFKPYNIAHPWYFPKNIKKYPENGILVPEHTSMEAFKEQVDKFRSEGRELTLYLNPFIAAARSTEYQVFRKQWRNPYNTYPQCPASSFTDYTIWHVNECIQKGGLQCVYVDSLGAVNCANPLHGCGYIDEKGVQHLTWPVRAMRKYMQRIYSLLHAEGRDQEHNFLWAHMSARTSAPINAFVDFQCSGEELEKRVITNSNYLELYTLDEYQIYFMKSSGVVPSLLPNLGRTGPKEPRYMEKYNDQILAHVLLHDTLIWPGWCYDKYVNSIYAKLDAWGYKDPALQYHSYRKQNELTADKPSVKISYYTLKGKTLAVAVNASKEDVETTINHPAGFVDMRTGKELPAKICIPGYNFALLELK